MQLLIRLTQTVGGLKGVLPIFKVNAKYTDKTLKFSPTVAEVKQMLKQKLSDGIKMVCSRPMLADEDKFKIYMSTLEEGDEKEEGRINPLRTVEESDDLKAKEKEIEEVLDNAFKELEVYKKELLPYIETHEKHCALNFNELEGQPDPVYRRWVESIDVDKDYIIRKLEETKTLGIISVDSSDMKKQILCKPDESRKTMEQIIPKHSGNIVESLMGVIKAIEKDIVPNNSEPVANWNIDEYVSYRKFLEEHRRNSDSYEEQLDKAKSLHNIMSEFKMSLSSSNKKALETLVSKWKASKERLKNSYEKCEAAESAQKSALAKKVPETRELLKSLLAELDAEKFYKRTEAPAAIVEDLAKIEAKIQNAENLCKNIEENQVYLQVAKDEFEEKASLREKHMHLSKFWADQLYWHENKAQWYQTQIQDLTKNDFAKKILEMKEVAKEAEAVLRVNYELNLDIAKVFQEKKLEPILSTIDVIKNVTKETVEDRHWNVIAKEISCKYTRKDPEFKFKTLMKIIKDAKKRWKEENKADAKIEEWIAKIAEQAMYEQELSRDFDKIKLKWDIHLTTKQVNNKPVVEDPERIFGILNECMGKLEKILGNEYAAPLREQAEQLYKNIAKIEEVLEEIIMIQNKMKMVDELITREEFRIQNFSTKYDEVVKPWRRYLKKTAGANEATRDTLSQRFLSPEAKDLSYYQELNRKMDEIIVEMEAKAEDKQLEYPRLYFLSNKEFVRALYEPDKLKALTACMQKCFANVKEILTAVEGDETYPIGVISTEGEEFKTNFKGKKITDSVDAVLRSMEEIFKKDLKTRVKSFYNEYMTEKKSRAELITSALCQASMVGESLIFTSNTETVIEEDEDYEDNMGIFLHEQCMAYSEAGKILTQASSTVETLSSTTHSVTLDNAKKMALCALIIQYVHYRDVVDFLYRNDVHGANNFYWQMQLRYYLQADTIMVKQLDASFEYGYEYLGVKNPSPITPNVERCWISYTSALRNKFWSTVVGPQDHGKLGTIQDLATALGKFCYPYVCTPNTSSHALENLLFGATGSSSWLVLENANELQYGALSALAYRLHMIRQLLMEDKNEWPINNTGKSILITPKLAVQGNNCPYFGIFLLVDHTSENKIKVPHSVKDLFRPIAITSMDLGAAAEAWLYSFGFKMGDSLGYKLEKFLKAAHDLISIKGLNNDLGLRTLHSIVKVAAELKFAQPDAKFESQVILLAIKTVFRSRLSESDASDIEKIARIVFQEAEIKSLSASTPEISVEIIQEATKTLSMEYDGDIAPKIWELHNVFNRRSGCVLVGSPVCGKTKLLELLRECYRLLYEPIGEKCEIVTLFPKSFNKLELYGRFEGKDWVEGILAKNLQRLVSQKQNKCYSLLHCDGPLDPSWVEQLQAAFESQKKLTLANGDFVFLENNVKVVFEVEDLKHTSPSTLARTGVVYLPKDTLIARNIVMKWLNGLHDKVRAYDKIKPHLINQINSLLNIGLEERSKISKLKEEKIQLSDNTIAITFCRLFESIYSMMEVELDEKKDMTDEKMKKLIGKVVVFSLAWAFGSSLTTLNLKKIDDFVGEMANVGDKPKESSCFDAYLRMRGGFAEFASWAELAPVFRSEDAAAPMDPTSPFKYSDTRSFTQMIVPTKQLIRYKWFIETLSARGKNVLIFGDSGCGKSLLATYALMQESEEDPAMKQTPEELAKAKNTVRFKKINLCFTWHTTSGKVHEAIEQRLEKKRMNLYSAPTRKQAAIFIDDVNLPKSDEYGSVPAMECLRGLIEKKGYFDRARYFWKRVTKTSFVCAASPAYGGRKVMSERLLRHFNVFHLNTTGYDDVRELFKTVVFAHFLDFPREYSVVKSGYLECILDVHDQIKQRLPGNPHKPHYLLSYKDAGKVLSGVLLGKKENVGSSEVFSRLLIHEFVRVYADRLTHEEDKEIFAKEIDKVIEKHLNGTWKLGDMPTLMFTGLASPDPSQYKEVSNWSQIQKRLEEEQERCNTSIEDPDAMKMDLVFFKEAVEYILKVSRILNIPRSHLINIGPQSLGRRSLIYIAACIHRKDFFTMDYNMRDFLATSKMNYSDVKASIERIQEGSTDLKGVVLLNKVGESRDDFEKPGSKPKVVEEHERNTESIMDALYQIAATGDLTHVGAEVNFDVRDYLHLIISIPNNISDVRKKMKMYPGLFSECHIVYQQQWPTEAAVSIASAQLANKVEDPIIEKVANVVVRMHSIAEEESKKAWNEEGRKILVTTIQEKEMPKLFLDIYQKRGEQLAKSRATLQKAIENVEQSKKIEKEYQEESAQKKPEGKEREEETDASHHKCQQLEQFIKFLKAQIGTRQRIYAEKSQRKRKRKEKKPEES
eukprot:TRINITY_DN2960_c0_g1_i1.p1 TRINITY_DN2960_c0_g1~~TRINITY_DN2960_c0_g1_i1.p1  ORF type:complete len:2343 (+),score=376.94 TRINITY_DN2960_c0_g1_i1:1637-8665(+)